MRISKTLLLILSLSLSFCATSASIERQALEVENSVKDFREPAYNCAPVELAKTDAYLEFARYEASKGRSHTAVIYIDIAKKNASSAFQNSRGKECLGDRDSDGIPDKDDLCPDDPEDFDKFEDGDGCPDNDNDRDTIPDMKDKCPMKPEDLDGFEDMDGCPDEDNDKDRIPDETDKCPDKPEDFDGFHDMDGCPDPDNDGDDIPDSEDKCPNDPGPRETDGCPYKRIQITDTMIVLKEKIFFEFNKAVINKGSYPLLDEISQALKDHPSYKIRIEGHTDNVGSDAFNKKLSQKRADAVKQYLVKKGISTDRLITVGHGEDKPIDDNDTEAGRAVNRRVEFHIISK